MVEPQELKDARRSLARAEAAYRTAEGLAELEHALELLEEITARDVPRHRTVAQNLVSTYSVRIYERIEALVAADRGLPEPELEHCFKMVLAFDQVGVDLPRASALKIEIARRLVDRYYEGYPRERKQQAIEQLLRLAKTHAGDGNAPD